MDIKEWRRRGDYSVEIDETLLDDISKDQPFNARVTERFKYRVIQAFKGWKQSDIIREACLSYMQSKVIQPVPHIEAASEQTAQVADYRLYDFSSLISSQNRVVIYTDDLIRFLTIHDHLESLKSRFSRGLRTDIVLPYTDHEIQPWEFSDEIRLGLRRLFRALEVVTSRKADYVRHMEKHGKCFTVGQRSIWGMDRYHTFLLALDTYSYVSSPICNHLDFRAFRIDHMHGSLDTWLHYVGEIAQKGSLIISPNPEDDLFGAWLDDRNVLGIA